METKPSINTSGRYKLQYRGITCLNCNHPLDISDKFCPNCSQANSTKKLTLKDFFEEFFSNIISYDSRLLKTLTTILTRPGSISKDYISGKRVSYTNPFRFLLSLAIIYFLLIGSSGNFDSLDKYGSQPGKFNFNLSNPILEDIQIKGQGEEKEQLLAKFDSLGLDSLINKTVRLRDSIILDDPLKELRATKDKGFFERYFRKQEIFSTLIKKDTLYSFDDAIEKYGIENTKSNKFAFSAAKSIQKAQRQPGAYINSLFSKLPVTTFFFLPIFSLFIWLIYIRKKYNYTDHLIFSFHNQSLLFILLIVSYLIDSIFETDSSWIFILIFSVYLYKAMRNFYKQGRFKTIVKYIFLNTIFIILASIGAILFFAGSIFTY
ncbi:DUF3667 domain-containing protein [Maribacter sp. CXY002]|uniref:DUF3667 domain-containing protein n=1 Tax=Maribacter luteocoastalis TaxID=3407671 RepID=UPI003B67667D